MATPAAVLSILVKAQGVQATSAQLGALDTSGRKAAAGLAKAEGSAKRSRSTFSALGSTAKVAAAGLGIAGLGKALSESVSEYREAQKAGAQTNAVLKSTHSAAKVTAKGVTDLANAISKKSGIDDEQIQQSENMLLTFTKVRNETGKGNKIFDQATQTVTDMSVALGQSGKTSAIQLGKALNDPIKGVTALRRVGVTFDDQQKKQISTMVKSGNTLGAQKVILKELNKEFSGSAAAQATAGDKLKVSLGNLAELAGGVLVPAFDKAAVFFTKLLDGMMNGTGVGGQIVTTFRNIVGAMTPFIQSIQQIVGWLQQHTTVAKVLAIALGVLAGAIIAVNIAVSANPFVLAAVAIAALVVGVVTAYREFSTFRNIVDTVVNAVKSALPTIVAIARTVLTAFVAVFKAVWPVIKGVFQGGFTAVKGIITGAAQILSGAVEVIKGVLHGDFGEIWDGIKKIFSGAFTAIKGIITGAAHALGAAASAVGDAIKGAFTSALRAAAGVVLGFVNGVIDIINKIPGVNIGHVKMPAALQSASSPVGNTAQGQTHGLAKGGAFGLTGGTVNRPMVMMGEEAPQYPEFVIPTNPAYKKRAQMLLAQAAGSIGLASGGIVGKVAGAASSAASFVTGGAKALLGKLPGTGSLPSWMKGMGSYVLGKVGSFVKKKITDILPGGGGKGKPGGGGLGNFDGLPVANWIIPALGYARKHGWSGHITSGYRDPSQVVHSSMVAPQGHSNHNFTAYPGGAIDVGSPSDRANGAALNAALAGYKGSRKLVWGGPVIGDWGHFSATGHRKGGIIGLEAGGVLGGNAKRVWQFLRGKGLTPAQAAGVVGSLQQESGLSTSATNPKSGAYGIGQWLGARKTALMARSNPGSLGTQLQYLWSELQGPESAALKRIKGAHSIADAAAAWTWGFERPGKAEANMGARVSNSRAAFNMFANVAGKGGGGATTSTSGAASAAQRTNPFDQKIANADLAIQQAQAGTIKIGSGVGARRISSALQQVQAMTTKRRLIGARIRSIRKALKGHLSSAKRLSLTQELTQRLQEHAQLGSDIQGLRTAPASTDTGAGVGTGDVGGDTGDPNQALIDSNTALQASIDAQVQADKDHTDALNGVRSELKRQTDFATSVSSTDAFQVKKYLADVLSGQVGGYGVAPRSFTPGVGVAHRY